MSFADLFFDYKNLTVALCTSIIHNIMTLEKAHNDQLAKLDLNMSKVNYNSFFQSSLDLDASNAKDLTILNMDSYHPDKEIRDTINDLSTEYDKFSIEQSMRKDVYNVFEYYWKNVFPTEKKHLSSEQIFYVNKCKLGYDMSGLSLDDEPYKLFKEYSTQLSANSNKFAKNIADVNTTFQYKKSDLETANMPAAWLDGKIPDSDGNIQLTLKYPDYVPIMEYCSDRSIRKAIATSYNSRCMETNTPLLKSNLQLRNKLAALYGKSYVDYKLQNRMAKNLATVENFLGQIQAQIQPLLKSELAELEQFAGHKLEPYDISYYSRLYKENKLNLKMNDLKQLFKTDTVIQGTMDIYQQLLGLKFNEITDSVKEKLWHEEVRAFEVCEITQTDQTTQTYTTIGYFFLDLHPREGKYSHAAVFPFIRRHVSDALTNLPFAVMACNFDKSSGTLDFKEVETFFHEFGHVMHNMCTKATISSLAGTSVERDFVETPSQFFENWCYDYEPLLILAPDIDRETVTKLQQMKKLLNGYHYSRQLVFALTDIKLHSAKEEITSDTDLVEIYNKVHTDTMGFEPIPGTNMLASFGHIMGGYDSGYYGYMWSEVYSELLLTKFNNKMLDPLMGARLKEHILAPGGTQDSSKSMEDFMETKLDMKSDIKLFIQQIMPTKSQTNTKTEL